jgi:predicted nucleic acid-binding protein
MLKNSYKKPTLYLETSIVSYLTSRISRDVVILAHQEITQRWWDDSLSKFDVYISQLTLEESGRGDQEAAKERLEALADFPGLPITEEIERLAAVYMKEIGMPPKAMRDALHIAVASVHGMDYLLSWNCKHIANGYIRRRIREINMREGFLTPTICTPEELLDED